MLTGTPPQPLRLVAFHCHESVTRFTKSSVLRLKLNSTYAGLALTPFTKLTVLVSTLGIKPPTAMAERSAEVTAFVLTVNLALMVTALLATHKPGSAFAGARVHSPTFPAGRLPAGGGLGRWNLRLRW